MLDGGQRCASQVGAALLNHHGVVTAIQGIGTGQYGEGAGMHHIIATAADDGLAGGAERESVGAIGQPIGFNLKCAGQGAGVEKSHVIAARRTAEQSVVGNGRGEIDVAGNGDSVDIDERGAEQGAGLNIEYVITSTAGQGASDTGQGVAVEDLVTAATDDVLRGRAEREIVATGGQPIGLDFSYTKQYAGIGQTHAVGADGAGDEGCGRDSGGEVDTAREA